MAMGWLVQYVPIHDRKEAHVVDGEPVGVVQEIDSSTCWLVTKTPIETRSPKATEVAGTLERDMPVHYEPPRDHDT